MVCVSKERLPITKELSMGSLALVLILVLLVWLLFNVLKSSNLSRRKMQIPGPYRLPIIGNILQLGPNPHQSLANLSKTYGPLMSLHLGTLYTVVVSSPQLAKDVLQLHDIDFSSRTIAAAAEAHDFHKNSLAFVPLGDKWRLSRKIFREHMFSTQRLDESKGLRLEKLMKLIEHVNECSVGARAVIIGEAAFVTALNLITTTLFSVDFTSFDSALVTQDLKGSVVNAMKILGVPNIADFFPILKLVDPQGIKREAEVHFGKLLDKFEGVINQRLKSRGSSLQGYPKKYDLLETLLNLMEQRDYNLNINDMKFIFLDIVLAGSDTVTNAVQWSMTELLLRPEKMANAKNELRSVVGENKKVKESDISRLPYLQAVFKEVLRLHPSSPFLVPRKADYDVEINGYTIPKNAQILVNIWAMGRDSSIWSNPTSFEPERFLDADIDYKGQDFMLIPFGSGRRICPGLPLADRMVPLIVASLIHNFEWKLEEGVKLDRTEKFGLTLHKAVPLMAIPIKV